MVAIDRVCRRMGLSWVLDKSLGGFRADTVLKIPAKVRPGSEADINILDDAVEHHRITLFKPKTFMNLNGHSVSKAVRSLNIKPTHLLAFHDDLDRLVGKVSLKNGGSSGGHNGVKSLIASLGSDEFSRVRIGIGRPSSEEQVSTYVLESFAEDDKLLVDNTAMPLCDKILHNFLHNGLK